MRSFNFEKSKKKRTFLGISPEKTFFLSADTYFNHGVSPIAEGVEFLPFFGLGRRKNNDILGIYFVRNNCVFSDAPEPVQNKIPKKVTFLGNFPGCIFHHVSFSWLCFSTVLSGWSTTSGWASEKTPFFRREKMSFFRTEKMTFFRTEKMTFFRVRQYGAFWLQRSHCGDGCHISLPTGLNLESAEINIQTCQFKTTNVEIHPAVPKVHTHLISFGQVEMANAVRTLGTLWWG